MCLKIPDDSGHICAFGDGRIVFKRFEDKALLNVLSVSAEAVAQRCSVKTCS